LIGRWVDKLMSCLVDKLLSLGNKKFWSIFYKKDIWQQSRER